MCESASSMRLPTAGTRAPSAAVTQRADWPAGPQPTGCSCTFSTPTLCARRAKRREHQQKGLEAPHDCRGGGRLDSRVAPARRRPRCRPGRYGLRRRSGPRGLRRSRLPLDFSVQPRARLGRPEREAAEGAFAPEGLVEVVTADHQACSWRKASTPSIGVCPPHRIGPKAKPRTYYVHEERRAGTLGRRGPARLFDNEKRT